MTRSLLFFQQFPLLHFLPRAASLLRGFLALGYIFSPHSGALQILQRELLLFFILLFLSPRLQAEPLSLKVHAKAAILINADTGAILFEKNAHLPLHPASITKIATAAYALEIASDRLLQPVTVDADSLITVSEEIKRKESYTQPAHWLIPDGSKMGIKAGEIYSLKDLLCGLMLPSGNDAANVIGNYLGGNIPAFMKKLNAFVQKLGCKNTIFYNPHGLHHPKHLTTAYDMALISRKAMGSPIFRKIVSLTRYVRPKTNKQASAILMQTNKMLRKGPYYYEKAIGIKTGYTSASQRTFVAAAKDGDRTLIAVLMKAKKNEIFEDAAHLFEAAFNQPKVERVLLRAGPTSYSFSPEGASRPISTYLAEPVIIDFYPAEEPSLTALLSWNTVSFPIQKDQPIGEISIQTQEGKVLRKVPLLASEEISSTWTFWLKTKLSL